MSSDDFLIHFAAVFRMLLQSDLPRSPWQEVLRASIPNYKKRVNLLLLGKTGHGKSATGNSALRRKEFESRASMASVTSEVKCGQVDLGNYVVKVIDSPGLADTNFNEDKVHGIEKAIENMEEVINICPQGIHAFLFVVKFGNRFTDEEQNTLRSLKHIFGHRFLEEHGIIVFTHGDAFEQAMEEEDTPDKSFEDWCEEQRGALGDLMEECEYRCVLFNNRETDKAEQKRQMENVVSLALGFDEVYTNVDFHLCEHLRQKLLLECKAPQLKENFQRKINMLNREIERECGSGNTSVYQFLRLEQETSVLEAKIRNEDLNTGLLQDVKEKVALARRQIYHYKQRQEEALRLRRESENNCCIL